MSKLLYLFPSAIYWLAAANSEIGETSAGVMIVFWVIGLALGIFWLWMLIDCAKRSFDQKVMWIILLIVLGWIGAIAYFFAVKRKAGKAAVPAAPQP